MKPFRYIVLAVAIFSIAIGGSVQAQHAFRLSEKEMRDLLKRIDKQSETFRSSLKEALDHSRFDDTKAEDRINDFVKDFEKASDRLKERFNDKRSASTEVEDVLRRAARIDDFMTRHRLDTRSQSDWAALRTSLDALAEAYNVEWNWTGHGTK